VDFESADRPHPAPAAACTKAEPATMAAHTTV